MLTGKGPKMNVGGIVALPVEGRVEHEGPCPVTNSLNASFGNSILVLKMIAFAHVCDSGHEKWRRCKPHYHCDNVSQ